MTIPFEALFFNLDFLFTGGHTYTRHPDALDWDSCLGIWHTGAGWSWWTGPADTLVYRSKGTVEWHKETLCIPRSSMWSWTPSSATVWLWWRKMSREGRGLTCQYGNWQNIFMPTMDSSTWPNRIGCKGRPTYSQASSTGSASGRIRGRRWAWLTRHATCLAICWWKHIRSGWRVQGQPFGRDSGGGWNTWSAELRLQRGCYWCTVRDRTAWAGGTGRGTPPPPPRGGGPKLPGIFT